MGNPESNPNLENGYPENKERQLEKKEEGTPVGAGSPEAKYGVFQELAGLRQYAGEQFGQNAGKTARALSEKIMKRIGLNNTLLAAEIITSIVCGMGGNDMGTGRVLAPLIVQSIEGKIEVALPPDAQSLVKIARQEGVGGVADSLADRVRNTAGRDSGRIRKFTNLVKAGVSADSLKQHLQAGSRALDAKA